METATQKPRCPMWIKVVLGLSLAANLAIVGLVSGMMLRGGPPTARAPSFGYAMPYVLALPREVRRDVFDTIRADDSLPDRRARRGAYTQMIALLRDDPLDLDAVRVVLNRQAEDAARVQNAAQEAWIGAVSRLSVPERVAYTERMEDAAMRKGTRKKDGPKGER